MKKKGSYVLGILIMAFGGLLLLGQLGINVGWIIGIIIPAYFLYKGWQMFIRNESSFKKGFGVILMIVGALWLVGMLPIILGLIFAGFLIYFGMKMIKNHKGFEMVPEMAMGEQSRKESFSSDIQYSHYAYDELDEWEKQINQNK